MAAHGPIPGILGECVVTTEFDPFPKLVSQPEAGTRQREFNGDCGFKFTPQD
jgi:hypothetical protein